MTERKPHKGLKAIEDLEANNLRLSEVVTSLSDFKKSLIDLASVVESAVKISVDSQRKTVTLGKTIKNIEEKLTTELKVKLAEGTAEQSSRLKDANEKLVKFGSDVGNLETSLRSMTLDNAKFQSQFTKYTADQIKILNANDEKLNCLEGAGTEQQEILTEITAKLAKISLMQNRIIYLFMLALSAPFVIVAYNLGVFEWLVQLIKSYWSAI
tara:strand:- start:189 stop:824 length:636 start_codon:yes stop_codon:yes gene_type:complete